MVQNGRMLAPPGGKGAVAPAGATDGATNRPCARFVRASGALAIVGGLGVLAGWGFDIEAAKSLVPGLATMKPITALCFVLCGAVLALAIDPVQPPRRARVRLATGLAALVALAGAASLAEDFLGLEPVLDRLVFAESTRAEAGLAPGRMAVATALGFVLLGGALAPGARLPPALREFLVVPVLMIGLLGVLGYLYGVEAFYKIAGFSTVALPTALLLVVVGLAALAVPPQRGLCALVVAPDSGGRIARWLLPIAILAPVVAGVLRWQGERAGLYDTPFGIALHSATLILLLVSMVLFTARRIGQFDVARSGASRIVEIQNRALERIALGAPLPVTLDSLLRDIEALDAEMITSILLVDADGRHLRHGAAPRLPASFVAAIDALPIGPAVGSCGTAAWRRQPVIVTDIASDPLWQDYRELAARHGLAACWSTPVFGENDVLLATFAIYSRRPGAPEEVHLRVIRAAEHAVAVAIDRERAVNALGQRTADLEAAQQRGKIGSWELDLDQPRGRWSRQLYRIFGIDPARPAPTLAELLERIHPEDRAPVGEALANRSPAGARQVDFRILTPGGGQKYVSGTVDVVGDSMGRPAGLAGTVLDITERKEAELAMQHALSRTRELSVRLAEAEEEERRNISRELHDRIGSDLAAAKLSLDLVDATLPKGIPEPLLKRLADARRLLRDAVAQSRNILAELRPPGLDEHGLRVALETHAVALEDRLGIPVALVGGEIAPPLPPLQATAIFRIVQEALNNAAKHAGAGAIEVSIDSAPGRLAVTVADDGVGFEAGTAGGSGYGFRTMRERAEAVGASLDIESRPGCGTRVTVLLERTP